METGVFLLPAHWAPFEILLERSCHRQEMERVQTKYPLERLEAKQIECQFSLNEQVGDCVTVALGLEPSYVLTFAFGLFARSLQCVSRPMGAM